MYRVWRRMGGVSRAVTGEDDDDDEEEECSK